MRPVYPMNKAGYIVPCVLFIKILPNLDKGIQIVGFLKEDEFDNTLKTQFDEQEQKYHTLLF